MEGQKGLVRKLYKSVNRLSDLDDLHSTIKVRVVKEHEDFGDMVDGMTLTHNRMEDYSEKNIVDLEKQCFWSKIVKLQNV